MEQTIYKTTANPLKPEAIAKLKRTLNVFVDSHGDALGDQLTDTQVLLIDCIARRRYPRTQLILPTQYGKSLSVALGVLWRAAFTQEKWAIVAPTEDKARIIMDYIIDHIFDHSSFERKLEYSGTKERLKQERSKTRITFKGFGEVRVYTADANNMQKVEKALSGFGAPNVILDESSLIPDKIYAMVKRMVGGTKDNFILEIGNPFFRNHFYRTWNAKRYIKIFIDAETALKEGRYTRDYLDEMKDEAFYDVLYDCHFPKEGEELSGGFRQLLSYAFIENAFIDNELPLGHKEDGSLIDKPILGIDPNHGGSNSTVMVVRFPLTGFAKVELKKRYADNRDVTGEIVADALNIIKKYGIEDYRVGVDAGGVGAGVADSLGRSIYVQAIQFGQGADNKERYANKKAEMYWEARKWIRSGNGKLLKHDGFLELKDINYKETSLSKIIMESKQELLKRGVESPDTADAFALTFINVSDIVDDEEDFIM
jgi:hypothetical protein